MAAKKSAAKDVFGWQVQSVVEKAQMRKAGKSPVKGAEAIFVGTGTKWSEVTSHLKGKLPEWQEEKIAKGDRDSYQLAGSEGPIWVTKCTPKSKGDRGFDLDAPGPYVLGRNLLGSLLGQWEAAGIDDITIRFEHLNDEEKLGVLVGLELASYKYLRTVRPAKSAPLKFVFSGVSEKIRDEAAAIGVSVNLARHLVNTPPNLLHPESYSETMAAFFRNFSAMKVDVWTSSRIEKDGMGLLMGVGQGAAHGPCLLHLRYRPKGAVKKSKPIAFVGKGITFDSGGLDIKPSSAMRLMKKDMGGSAAVLGVAHYVAKAGLKQPCDFYIPMAENAVDQLSFRPGDVLKSRHGMTVEIDNTDAEGRLILADALDLAASQKGENEPELIIDVATLTGAARVAVGTEIGAMFVTSDKLARQMMEAGYKRGDYVWQMPLFAPYESSMSSQFADVNHCSTSGFGGAITAALFLKKFVRSKPWIHLDVMAWTDAKNAYRESGGNGQTVQCLIEFLQGY